jgi:hypothetical protein
LNQRLYENLKYTLKLIAGAQQSNRSKCLVKKTSMALDFTAGGRREAARRRERLDKPDQRHENWTGKNGRISWLPAGPSGGN